MVQARGCSIFVLPVLKSPLRSELGLLVLPDGNTRARAVGGYAQGASKVIVIAEHLARARSADRMVACVLSKENIAKRSDGFFSNLLDAFTRLGHDIESRGRLVNAGVRAGLCGSLDTLHAHGGVRGALARAIEAAIAKTSHVEDPALRLYFGIGYDSDAPRELDIDVILRTGMEEEGVCRVSGLRPRSDSVCISSTKLWPSFEPEDMDAALALLEGRRRHTLAPGHAPGFVAEVVSKLSRAAIDVPLQVTLAVTGPPRSVLAALASRAPAGPRPVAIAIHDAGHRSQRFGTSGGHELHVIPAEHPSIAGPARGYDAFLAPGQMPSARFTSFVLPASPAVGYATICGCEASGRGVVDAMRAASQFLERHTPLFGAERERSQPR